MPNLKIRKRLTLVLALIASLLLSEYFGVEIAPDVLDNIINLSVAYILGQSTTDLAQLLVEFKSLQKTGGIKFPNLKIENE